MESLCSELALYGSKNECAKTDNIFSLISEVRDGTVSLIVFKCSLHTLVVRTDPPKTSFCYFLQWIYISCIAMPCITIYTFRLWVCVVTSQPVWSLLATSTSGN